MKEFGVEETMETENLISGATNLIVYMFFSITLKDWLNIVGL